MNARRDRITPPLTASRNPKASSPGLLASCLLCALVAGAGCGGTTALPTGFGVNLTISLDPGVRNQVRSVNIHVTGAEQFDKIVDITAFRVARRASITSPACRQACSTSRPTRWTRAARSWRTAARVL